MKAYERYIKKEDVDRIHENTLRILSEVGVNFESERALEIFKKHGARVCGETVYLEQEMVEQAVAGAPEQFTLYSNTYEDTIIGGGSMMTIPLASNIYIEDHNGIRKTTNE
ncbi:MAG: trimethylamine methyltransferase family protein, partial [Eubacterium sp.]